MTTKIERRLHPFLVLVAPLALALSLALAPIARADGEAAPAAIPVTGPTAPGLEAFDEAVVAYMRARQIPAGALAVAKDGRLLLARGYGYADEERTRPTPPDALFRVASISKSITGVAVLRLLEEHPHLTLKTGVVAATGLAPHLAEGAGGDAAPDARLGAITIAHCLHHTGGWDRGASGDPMFKTRAIAAALGLPSPALPEAVCRFVLGRPLDFDPGARHVYSNFGYCLLGRMIEAQAGLSYEAYVRGELLAPLGITDMKIGRALPEERDPREVWYADPGVRRSVFGAAAGAGAARVRSADGGFSMQVMDSHGGWIASAPDLVRFAAALDHGPVPLLSQRSLALLFARPKGPAGYDEQGRPKAAYYACGWVVRPAGDEGRANHWHNGSLPGTWTLLVRRHDGLVWAALFNQRRDPSGQKYGAIDAALHQAAARVERWPAPEHDLFETFYGVLR